MRRHSSVLVVIKVDLGIVELLLEHIGHIVLEHLPVSLTEQTTVLDLAEGDQSLEQDERIDDIVPLVATQLQQISHIPILDRI